MPLPEDTHLFTAIELSLLSKEPAVSSPFSSSGGEGWGEEAL